MVKDNDLVESQLNKMLKLGRSMGSDNSNKEVEIELEFEPEDMTLLSASEDLLNAIEEKDAKNVSLAFKEMFNCLMQYHEDEEKGEEEDEEMEAHEMLRHLGKKE